MRIQAREFSVQLYSIHAHLIDLFLYRAQQEIYILIAGIGVGCLFQV